MAAANSARHEAFSELYNLSYNLSHTQKEDFVVPEITVVGGDLETRSSVVESILGTRLNISKFESSIATPIVIQSCNKPSCSAPEIRVLNPAVGDFTPPLSLSFETAVADAVLSTCPQNKDSKAVVIRCVSSTAPNLQILLPIQTTSCTVDPAAVDDAEAADKQTAVSMVSVKKLARQLSPQHRMVLAIATPHETHETSSSIIALAAALRADRSLSRTTIIVPLRKWDLTAIEASKKKAYHLLHADILSALPKSSSPPVVAVYLPPPDQGSTGNAWAKALSSCDQALQAVASRIAGLGRAPPAASGSVNTRALLEKQFVSRQQAAAQGMLSMLQLRCDGARNYFQDAQRALEAMMDAGQLRRAHMATVSELLDCFSSLLAGKGCIDMDQHGLTSSEECDALGEASWPLIALLEEGGEEPASGEEAEEYVVPIGAGPTAEVPLYGVAAAQRCLEEFDALLEHAGTFQSEAWKEARRLFDVHRIANMLLAQDDIGLRLTGNIHGHGRSFFGQAPSSQHHFDAEDSFPEASPDAQRRVGHSMGRIAADQLLKPLVAALCTRLKQILTKLPALALAEFKERSGGFGASDAATPPPKLAENFLKALEGKTCELVASAQDHVQQQLATIIKHTHVAAHWPQVPVAMATGRAAGSVATSISDISSHHLIASGAMHAQAVGEALSGSESGDDGNLSGLAAAMGRLRSSNAGPTNTEAASEDESEEEEEEADDADESEQEGSDEDDEEEQDEPVAVAQPAEAASEAEDSAEEDDSSSEASAEPPAPSPPPLAAKKKSQESPKSRKSEVTLSTQKVTEPEPQSKGSKKSKASSKPASPEMPPKEQAKDTDVPSSSPAKGDGGGKSSPSPGKKAKAAKGSAKSSQHHQESESKAPVALTVDHEDDSDAAVEKKKYSKSAPGHLAKDKVPKHKSQAGQAADAAAAEALSASTPPASTADGAVESASRKKKKGDKSLKGTVELDAEKVNSLAETAKSPAPEPAQDQPSDKKKSPKKQAKSRPESTAHSTQHTSDSVPFTVPSNVEGDEEPETRPRALSTKATSRKSVRVSLAGSPELAVEDLAAAEADDRALEVTDVRRASQRTARSSRHVSVAGSARGSVHSLAADATAAQSRHRDPDDAEGEASAQNSASENSEGDHEDGSDADVGVAIDGDHWSDHQADRGSAGPEENRGFMAQESFREHPATHHPVYIGVMRHVGEMFDEIRASVTTYGISNCLRAALLQPLSSPALKQTAMTSLFSGSDSDMLAQYASQDAMHSMRCDLEHAAERQAALQKCKRLFDNVAAGDAEAQAASIWSGVETGGIGSGVFY